MRIALQRGQYYESYGPENDDNGGAESEIIEVIPAAMNAEDAAEE